MWFLAWTPFAIIHGLNPLHTTLLNYPIGLNTAQNTQIPLLGIVSWPVTYLLGPVASWNLLAWLAFPLSGFAMFSVLRAWRCATFASAIGGLVYGFSPYMVGEGEGHLNLLFVPLPPLIFFALYRLFVVRVHPWRWALITSLLALAQLLISTEVLTTTAVVAALALVVLTLGKSRAALRALRQVASPVAVAAVLFAAIISYPVWYIVAGPHHFQGPVWGYGNPLHADLLGPFIPSNLQLLYPPSLRAIGSRFVGGALSENGTYIGIPMVLGIGYLAIRTRRSSWFVFSLGMVAISFVLSLGDRLVVDSHATSIYLPMHLVSRVPILEDVIAARFSLYEYLFIAVAVALGISELQSRVMVTKDSSRVRVATPWLGGLIAVTLIGLSLLPNWPYSTAPVGTASLFAPHPEAGIPVLAGAALVYPYPLYSNDSAMLWQAESLMRFSLLGGYALTGRPRGATILPARLRPVQVQAVFASDSTLSYFPMRHPLSVSAVTPVLVRAFVRNNDIQDIVIEMSEPGAADLGHLMSRTFGDPHRIDGFEVWTGPQMRRVASS